MRWVGYVVLVLSLVGCGDDVAGAPDGGAPDAGAVDAGPPPESRPATAPLTQWVNPFIGTGGLGFGVGSAFPSPQVPFGMARPGPDTLEPEDGAPGFAHCAGYWYSDSLIHGFSNTRPHGMGAPEYGAVSFMPVIGMGPERTTRDGYWSAYSHDNEEASPGYYAVTLDDSDVRVELTATARVGLHRYTFPAGSDATVVMDLSHTVANEVSIIDASVTIDPDEQTFTGFATFSAGYSGRFGGQPIYFAARFSQPFVAHGVWKAGTLYESELSRDGADAGAWARFDASTDAVVELAVGISFVDEAHARMNLDAEMATFDFEGTRAAAERAWEDALSKVEIEGRSEREFTIFYTALYHSLLMPTLATDVDGSYRGIDAEVHLADGWTYYTDFSLWDTFRTQHPLLTLLYPEWQTDMLRSLTAMGTEGGFMPRWPLGIGYTGGMVGDSADMVFADSWVKGVRDFDLDAAYAAMRRSAMESPVPGTTNFGGRRGIAEYVARGWVPIEEAGASASATLEFAYADYAMSVLAEAAGEPADAAMFAERAGNYRNLYDPASGFLIGRHADGSFDTDVDPFIWQDYYAEGNAWQYLWYAPHDLAGLAELMGGSDALASRLTMFFEQSEARPFMPLIPALWYWHGNEPDLHAPWIFSALDRPDDSAKWTRWVMERHYGDGPDGLPGNDDAGTLSAWYVFSSTGFFPITALDYYLVGSPVFTRAVFHLQGGDFVIEAPEASGASMYVGSATLDGAALDRARIPHADIADGATLQLQMSAEPVGWATTR